jgi:hypothetical protein
MSDISGERVAHLLKDKDTLCAWHPTQHRTDRGPMFTNQLNHELLRSNGTNSMLSPAFYPQTECAK